MRMSRRATIHFPAGFDPSRDLTYTGSMTIIDDGDGNYRVKFTSSGTLTFTKDPGNIDLFLVGGGGGGGRYAGTSDYYRGGGGGGGHVNTVSSFAITVGTGYAIVVGAGGIGMTGSNGNGTSGGASSAFGNSASGGGYGYSNGDGGDGGSGGGATGAYGGADGADGTNNNDTSAGIYNWGGAGDGVTTKEFGESTGDQYGDGGSGYQPAKGTAPTGLHGDNSGYGGKGGYTTGYEATDGKSGIVIIRIAA